MKTRKFNKRLTLSKVTIATLGTNDLFQINGGAMPPSEPTEFYYCTDPGWTINCATWEVECQSGWFFCTKDAACG